MLESSGVRLGGGLEVTGSGKFLCYVLGSAGEYTAMLHLQRGISSHPHRSSHVFHEFDESLSDKNECVRAAAIGIHTQCPHMYTHAMN